MLRFAPAVRFAHDGCAMTQESSSARTAGHLGQKLLVLLALAVAACAHREDAPAQTLRFHNMAEPRTLDPAGATGVADRNLLLALCEGLAAFDPRTGAPVPGVAERWELSADGLLWTFHLRAARWSNGDPLTADDFRRSWLRVLDPATASPLASQLFEIVGAAEFATGTGSAQQVGIEARSDRELRVRLRRPMPWLAQLSASSPLVPVHSAAGSAGAFVRRERFVGNGPFVLDERVPNFRIVMVKNPNYWDAGNVTIQRIVAYSTESKQAAVDAFRAGRTDWVDDFPSAQASSWLGRPELRTSPYLAVSFLRFNTTKAPFRDARVRRAIHMAIDRTLLCERVLRLGQRPAQQLVPRCVTGVSGYVPVAGLPFSPEKARALLAEAGFPQGRGLPPIELQYDTNEDWKRICEAVQAMLREHLQIDVYLVNKEKKTVIDDEERLAYLGMSRGSWIGDFADPMAFLEVFTSSSSTNRTGFANAQYDALLERARASADEPARRTLMAQAERLLVEEELPFTPLYEFVKQTLVHPERIVDGFHENLLGMHPMKWIRLRR